MVINNVSGSWGRIVTGLMIVLAIVNVRYVSFTEKIKLQWILDEIK